MSAQFHALTHGTNGLLLSYATVLLPMIVGLRQGRAPMAAFLRSVVLAIPVMLIAWIVMSIAGPALGGLGMSRGGVLELLLNLAGTAAIGYAAGRVVASRVKSSESGYRRGAVISNAQSSRRRFRGAPHPDTPITLAGLLVAPEDETKHFKLVGTTGTGKSTAIREMLSAALARGDRAIIADPDGGYLDSFYNAERGDVILSPFEAGAAKWNLLGEITKDYDVEQIARSLIPDNAGDHDRIWSEYARTFFTAVVQQTLAGGIKDDAVIYRILNSASVEELRLMLAGTPAGPFLADGSERMFGSLRSVTTSAIKALKYTTRQQGAPFSVRKWVREGAARHAGGRGGALFLPYKAGEIAAMRSTISAWMRIAIFEAMDRGEGDQFLWFIVDELDALGEIDGLKDALARLRKFGGRCVLGFQSIAQVSGTYGKGTADTIVENCGNTLILRCSASEHGGTSEFVSKLIGQREVMHTTQSSTRKSHWWRTSSITTSQHLKIEPAVMASEIERLPDLEGYLKFASIPDWTLARLTPVSYPKVIRAREPNAPIDGANTSTPTVVAPPADAPAAAASPTAASSSQPAAASPPTPARRRKSQAPRAKRARNPKPAAAHAPTSLSEANATQPGIDSAVPAAQANGNGAIENRGGGAELRD
jgi:type IV secretory pathway TraG/TraD family ATPase VirD4